MERSEEVREVDETVVRGVIVVCLGSNLVALCLLPFIGRNMSPGRRRLVVGLQLSAVLLLLAVLVLY